jgi:hypothetical protein
VQNNRVIFVAQKKTWMVSKLLLATQEVDKVGCSWNLWFARTLEGRLHAM